MKSYTLIFIDLVLKPGVKCIYYPWAIKELSKNVLTPNILPNGGIAPCNHPVFLIAYYYEANLIFFAPAAFLNGGHRNLRFPDKTHK